MRDTLISVTFDDGLRCQFGRALPVLDRFGLPATFFLVANTDPIHTDGCQHPDWPKITFSQADIQLLRDMIKRGHEIGSHSVHHREPYLSHEPASEASHSKQYIESWLETTVTSYGYPFYHVTEPIRAAVIKAGYDQARGGAGGSYYASGTAMDRFRVDCRQIARTGENVQLWARPGCWHVLTFHGIGTYQDGWEPASEAEFTRQMTQLASLRDSGAVEVVTFRDGAARLHAGV